MPENPCRLTIRNTPVIATKRAAILSFPTFSFRIRGRSQHYINRSCILEQDGNGNTGNFQAGKVKKHAGDDKHPCRRRLPFFFFNFRSDIFPSAAI